MPRHIDPPKTILERGFRNYLEDGRPLHNGLGYTDFVERLRLRVSKTIIAEDFHISKRTVYYWIKVYQQESTATADQG